MRLDKFLKVSRLIKRRTVAKEVTEQGRVLINGRPAKAASTVQVGDELSIRFGQKTVYIRVEALQESPRKDEADSLYTLLREQFHAEDETALSHDRD